MKKIFGYDLYPPFRLGEPRFPQDKFLGRYLHFIDIVDPRTLLTTDEKLNRCLNLLNDYKEGKLVSASDKELWNAQKIKTAILHPDTNEKIFPAFRMSGYVPFGWITVTGMLMPNPSWMSVLFWQWMNQSHNALVNYSNRNATQNQPTRRFFASYCIAVSTACSIAAGLTSLIRRTNSYSVNKRMFIQRFIPLPATSIASSLNILFMRWNEIGSGIEVYDSKRNPVGISKIAAKKAVLETTMTRSFLPIPILILPPLIMPYIEKLNFVKKSKRNYLLVNAFICTISFAFSLPISLALFPQESKIFVDELERELKMKTEESVLYYNRGL